MKTRRSGDLAWALFLSCSLALPTEIPAQSQAAGQRAGEVSRVIPAVSIGRAGKTITAKAKSEVDWQDEIDTQASARARVLLDDGSVLNVGADSSMRVIKHDSAAQQTELELTYGKLRSQAQKLSKGDGKFEVRTPAGVAGVVGTDFYVEYSNDVMNVIVFEGFVRVCNLAGLCVVVKPGQMSSVRRGDNSAPPTIVQAPLSMLTGATTETENGGSLAMAAPVAAHSLLFTAILIGVVAAIPAVIVPVEVNRSQPGKPPSCQELPRKGLPQPNCLK